MTNAITDLEAAAEAIAPVESKRKSRPYVIFAIVVGVIVLAYFGFRWLMAGKESTDDAQVASDMVPIAARVAGAVMAVPVVDHQAVKKGQLLAQIDPAEYETKVTQAKAERDATRAQADAADAQVRIVEASSRGGLGAARAALSGTTASVAGADAHIAAAKAAVTHAQADADKVVTDLRRAESLRKDDAVPQAEVDSLHATAAAARAAIAQAIAQLAVAEEGKRAAQARIAEAQGRVDQSAPVDALFAAAKANAEFAHARVASAEAAFAQAQLNVSYTTVVAPLDGHISRLAVHAGQLVAASQVITTVLPKTTYIVANFKETQVGGMRPGQAATISMDAFPGRTFRAKVESIAFGTGAQFSLLPPDNASGNFVKVVQRVPVNLVWTDLPDDIRVEAGLSADVTVVVK
jgi:membrane fusion protein (multidrug efflux system)